VVGVVRRAADMQAGFAEAPGKPVGAPPGALPVPVLEAARIHPRKVDNRASRKFRRERHFPGEVRGMGCEQLPLKNIGPAETALGWKKRAWRLAVFRAYEATARELWGDSIDNRRVQADQSLRPI